MRSRAFLIASLVLNTVLIAWGLSAWRNQAALDAVEHGLREPILTNRPKTMVVVRKQFFTWTEVESPNYEKYIANLRDIGCPEATIRDIIVADVNQLYARKRATEVITTEQQWWRSEPDPEIEQAAMTRLAALDQERRDLLNHLLGANWDLDDTALLSFLEPRTIIALDGPVLGELSPEVKLKVREIVARQRERAQAYLDQATREGRELDSVELAKLQQQTRNELAGLLSPGQLEEFLLRYSDNAQNLRAQLGDLRYFNASSEEFRALFRVLDPLQQQLRLLGSGTDDASVRARSALEQQQLAALKGVLPPERFALYEKLQDPLFRYAMDVAGTSGNARSVGAVYDIAKETAIERLAVESNPGLSAGERELRMKQIELEQLKANLTALGQLPMEEPQQTKPPGTPHVIRPGDSIERLAALYGVTVPDLMALNAGRDILNLRPGDSLVLPLRPMPPQPRLPGR